MRTALIAAALLAATSAAHAFEITHILRDPDGFTVALSDKPCPTSQYRKIAIYNSREHTAAACYTRTGRIIDLDWFKSSAQRLDLPETLNMDKFVDARN